MDERGLVSYAKRNSVLCLYLVVYLAFLTVWLSHTYLFSWDSAEYAWNIEHGKVGHPPGHPVYFLVGMGAYAAIFHPLGLDGETTLMSLALAYSIGFVVSFYYVLKTIYSEIIPIERHEYLACIGVILLGTSPIFVLNFLWVETYMLSAMLVALSMLVFLRSHLDKSMWGVYASTLPFSLSMAASEPSVFYLLFFLLFLVVHKQYRWSGIVVYLLLTISFTFLMYAPVYYSVGSIPGGIAWIVNPVNPENTIHWNAAIPFDILVKRAIASFGVFGAPLIGYVSFLLFRLRKGYAHKEILPFVLPPVAFVVFLWTGGHYIEQLFLVLPLLCIVTSLLFAHVSPAASRMFVVVLFFGGVAAALWMGAAFDYKDAIIDTTVTLIEQEVPKGAHLASTTLHTTLVYYLPDHNVVRVASENGSVFIVHDDPAQGMFIAKTERSAYKFTDSPEETLYFVGDSFETLPAETKHLLESQGDLALVGERENDQRDSILWWLIAKPESWQSRIAVYRFTPASSPST